MTNPQQGTYQQTKVPASQPKKIYQPPLSDEVVKGLQSCTTLASKLGYAKLGKVLDGLRDIVQGAPSKLDPDTNGDGQISAKELENFLERKDALVASSALYVAALSATLYQALEQYEAVKRELAQKTTELETANATLASASPEAERMKAIKDTIRRIKPASTQVTSKSLDDFLATLESKEQQK